MEELTGLGVNSHEFVRAAGHHKGWPLTREKVFRSMIHSEPSISPFASREHSAGV
jgi:hypothetical protein